MKKERERERERERELLMIGASSPWHKETVYICVKHWTKSKKANISNSIINTINHCIAADDDDSK